jgi:hypothetical protein
MEAELNGAVEMLERTKGLLARESALTGTEESQRMLRAWLSSAYSAADMALAYAYRARVEMVELRSRGLVP